MAGLAGEIAGRCGGCAGRWSAVDGEQLPASGRARRRHRAAGGAGGGGVGRARGGGGEAVTVREVPSCWACRVTSCTGTRRRRRQFLSVCSDTPRRSANSRGDRPVRNSSTASRRNSGGYGGRVLGVDRHILSRPCGRKGARVRQTGSTPLALAALAVVIGGDSRGLTASRCPGRQGLRRMESSRRTTATSPPDAIDAL
jgi:hypothetical protein